MRSWVEAEQDRIRRNWTEVLDETYRRPQAKVWQEEPKKDVSLVLAAILAAPFLWGIALSMVF